MPTRQRLAAHRLARRLLALVRPPRRRTPALHVEGAAPGEIVVPESALEPVEEPLRGCGWFDSSHDLRSGLQVREHASADDVSALLPVAAWLDLHLAQSGRMQAPRPSS